MAGSGGDEEQVAALTQQFIDLLERAEQAEAVEQERYGRMLDWLQQLRQVNGEMREIAEWRLRWSEEIKSYVRRLREKAHGPESSLGVHEVDLKNVQARLFVAVIRYG